MRSAQQPWVPAQDSSQATVSCAQHVLKMHRGTGLSTGKRFRCCLAAARPALREVVALALWHAANWFREALNAFAGDPPMATCAHFLVWSSR